MLREGVCNPQRITPWHQSATRLRHPTTASSVLRFAKKREADGSQPLSIACVPLVYSTSCDHTCVARNIILRVVLKVQRMKAEELAAEEQSKRKIKSSAPQSSAVSGVVCPAAVVHSLHRRRRYVDAPAMVTNEREVTQEGCFHQEGCHNTTSLLRCSIFFFLLNREVDFFTPRNEPFSMYAQHPATFG